MKRLLFRVVWVASLAFGLAAPGTRATDANSVEFRLPEFKTLKLENGMTVFLMERRQIPLVSLQWVLRTGGSVCDPKGKEGLADLTARMLRKGAGRRSTQDISQAIDFVGGELEAGAALEYAHGGGEFMAKDLGLALDLLADMLQRPTLPGRELDKLTKQQIDGIKQAKMVPNEVIGRYYSRFLFDGHPYGRPVGGTETTLAKLHRKDVVNFHRRQYSPEGLILALVGDFSSAEVETTLRAKFGQWEPGEPEAPHLEAPARVQDRQVLLVDKPDATQTFFRIGDIGLARTNADWVAVGVVNTLFGGRFTSMLNSALRIQSGLTYGARSGFGETVLPGSFAIGSFTQNEKTTEAIEMTLDVLKKLHEEGLTAEQLQSAQTYVKGQFGPKMETNDQLAEALCEMEFYGLGMDYYDHYFRRIDSVTLADARRVIDEYFPRDALRMVFIGQQKVMEPVARKLASRVVNKTLEEPGF